MIHLQLLSLLPKVKADKIANNVRVPYYAKEKRGVGVPLGLDA